MKKFKIIRNVLIVVVILVTIMYVCWLRSNQIESSKTAKLYNKMFEDSYKEQKNITMQISYKNEKMKMTSKIKFYMIEKQMWFFVKILSKLRKFYFKYLKRNYN